MQRRSRKPSTATENGTPLRGDGWGVGRAWEVYPAGLTRRYTKNKGRWCAPENGEQRTENRTPLRGDGWSGVPGLFGLIAAKGGGPGFNLCGSSKHLNL